MGRNELKAIVLFSGGFDSMAMLEHVISLKKYYKYYLLYFDYGNVNKVSELRAIQSYFNSLREFYGEAEVEQAMELVIVPMGMQDNSSTTLGGKSTGDMKRDEYVPLRNFQFLAKASAIAETLHVRDIYFGAVDDGMDYYPDTSPLFVENINKLVGGMTVGNIRILAPFNEMRKEDILDHLLEKVGKESAERVLDNATTCNVTTSASPCLKCESCEFYEDFKIKSWKLLKDCTD